MLRRVAFVRTDVWEEVSPKFSETSLLKRATRRNIPKDVILHLIYIKPKALITVNKKSIGLWGTTSCHRVVVNRLDEEKCTHIPGIVICLWNVRKFLPYSILNFTCSGLDDLFSFRFREISIAVSSWGLGTFLVAGEDHSNAEDAFISITIMLLY
jgi:hypothetical protein